MIRGAIEVARSGRVAGWIFSDDDGLRDKTVLAFVAGRCVGAGKVDKFRQDLLDAKLGNGYCGFDFPVKLADGEPVGAIIVKLQFSDVALIQAASLVMGPDDADAAGSADLGAVAPASVAWMMDRGMLEQAEYDFLKCIQSAGAYERGLRVGKRNPPLPDQVISRLNPKAVAQEMLALFLLSDVPVVEVGVAAVADLVANSAPLRRAAAPVAAIWSKERGRILLEERSHLGGRKGGTTIAEPAAGSIEYSFGPDRLLFVHRDCKFAALGPAPATGLTVFTVPMQEAARAHGRPVQVRAA